MNILWNIRKSAGWGQKLQSGFSTMMTGGHLAPFNPVAMGQRAVRGMSNMMTGKPIPSGRNLSQMTSRFLQGPI
jgi:hypothetical protein